MLNTFNPTAAKNKINSILRKLYAFNPPHSGTDAFNPPHSGTDAFNPPPFEDDAFNPPQFGKGLKEKLVSTTEKLHKAVELNRKVSRWWKRFQNKYPVLSKTIMAIAAIYMVLGSAYALVTFGNRLVRLAISVLTVIELYVTPMVIGAAAAISVLIILVLEVSLFITPAYNPPMDTHA